MIAPAKRNVRKIKLSAGVKKSWPIAVIALIGRMMVSKILVRSSDKQIQGIVYKGKRLLDQLLIQLIGFFQAM
ncbi:hypothetical protein D3C75_957570 [compost metagenome]